MCSYIVRPFLYTPARMYTTPLQHTISSVINAIHECSFFFFVFTSFYLQLARWHFCLSYSLVRRLYVYRRHYLCTYMYRFFIKHVVLLESIWCLKNSFIYTQIPVAVFNIFCVYIRDNINVQLNECTRNFAVVYKIIQMIIENIITQLFTINNIILTTLRYFIMINSSIPIRYLFIYIYPICNKNL